MNNKIVFISVDIIVATYIPTSLNPNLMLIISPRILNNEDITVEISIRFVLPFIFKSFFGI